MSECAAKLSPTAFRAAWKAFSLLSMLLEAEAASRNPEIPDWKRRDLDKRIDDLNARARAACENFVEFS
jgi:hypothetical protein